MTILLIIKNYMTKNLLNLYKFAKKTTHVCIKLVIKQHLSFV